MGWENVVCSLPHRIAKAVKRTIHRMVRLPCLLTFSEEPLCGPVFHGGQPYTARPPLSLRDISPTLWGNLPAPPQPLKRLAKLLCCSNPFGAVVDLGKLPFFRANLPFFAAILREFEIFFYIPEITVEK